MNFPLRLGLNPFAGSDSKMTNLPPHWRFSSGTSRGIPSGDSGSKEEEKWSLIDTAEPAHWTPASSASESSGFSDIFQILSDIHLQEPSSPLMAKTTDDILTTMSNLEAIEHGDASNSTRKRRVEELELRKCLSEGNEQFSSESERKEEQKPKRTRSAETHNMSERRRRGRIKEKIRYLQQLIPKSEKKDCASILDEAVEYLKTLKVQAQLMSMGMGTIYYNPYMSATGIPNMPLTQYSPYLPFRPGLGLVPLVPIPSSTQSPSVPISGSIGLPAVQPTNTAIPSPQLDNKGKGLAFKEIEMLASDSQEASTSGQISSKSSAGSIVHATHIVPPAPERHRDTPTN